MIKMIYLVLACLCLLSTLHAEGLALAPLGSNAFLPEDMPRTGYYTDIFKDPDTGNDLIRYCIKTPDKLPDRRTLVLIADFHGCGGNEENFKWVKANYPGIDENNLMWIGMKAQGRCWEGNDHERITKCLAWAIKIYPVDERRIFFRGYSSGAFLQKNYGAKRQDLVAGIIQYAGGGGIQQYGKDPENFATEFYLCCGEKDKFCSSAILPEIKSLSANNYRFVARFWDQHDHTSHFNQNDPQVAAVSKDIMHWVFALRHKTRGLYNENITFLKSVKKMEDSELWNDQACVTELVRIGGIEAGMFVADALKSKEDTIVLKAIAVCTDVNFSNDVTNALGKLFFKSKNEDVRLAAGKALRHLANWRHLPAQNALCAKLTEKKATNAEKLISIAAIDTIVNYQLYGSQRSDLNLYKSLIIALNDESEAVRNAAFTILKKCHDNDYGFQASMDKKERKTAVRGWQGWFATFMEEHG